jgi:rhodanese-related sulfurtransferase
MNEHTIFPQDFVEKYTGQALGDALVIDVREMHEWDYYHLEHSTLMPMKQIPQRLADLPLDRDLYIICAHGVRSAVVTDYLIQQQQYSRVYNVAGGMAVVAELLGFEYD